MTSEPEPLTAISADFLGRLAATLQRHSHDVSLRLQIWRRGACGTAIIINGKRFHHSIDRIAICNRLIQGLQHHHSGPFTQHSATCALVKEVERRFAVQDPSFRWRAWLGGVGKHRESITGMGFQGGHGAFLTPGAILPDTHGQDRRFSEDARQGSGPARRRRRTCM